MKTIAALLPVLWLASGLAVAGQAPPGESADENSRRAVLALEDQWVQAEIHKDGAALNRILDDRFVVTFGSGRTVGKDQFIKGIVESSDRILSQELSDRTVLVQGDTVVVVETDTARGTDQGKDWHVVLRLTTVYVRRDGQWAALAEQMVSVKQPDATTDK